MTDNRLETSVGGVALPSCIYAASGPRTGSIEALEKIGASKSGAILSKSATLVKQDGNTLPRFLNKIDLGEQFGHGSMNSEGLPNQGIDYYISPDAVKSLTSFYKPYIVSLSGLTLADNLEMLDRAYSISGISAIELNLACPNIPNKPIIAYDFEQLEEVLKSVTTHPKFGSKPLGIKLAPYFDKAFYEKIVSTIIKYPIKYIVTTNTMGYGLFVDSESESTVMSANSGYGGIGGGFIKPISLANVRMIYQLLQTYGRGDIDIVGVGGIFTGKDAFEMLLCGAKAVQVGTCHWVEGSACFERIERELLTIMDKKGYKSIEEFRGKLKSYDAKVSSATRNVYQLKEKKLSTSKSGDEKKSSNGITGILVIIIVALIAIILYDKVLLSK